VLMADPSRPMQASHISGRLATPTLCNEADPSSRDATARAFAFPSFSGRDCSLPLKGRLQDFRPIILVNTFQFTRTTKLRLALSEIHESAGVLDPVACNGSDITTKNIE